MSCLSCPRSVPALLLLSLLAVPGCSKYGDPFSYVHVSGTITYADGSRIASPELVLTFYSQTPRIDNRTYPRPGMVAVDVATGKFGNPTTHKANDGLVRGKHKVTVTHLNHSPISSNLVPPEYADPTKTPLEVDTTQVPFVLQIRKP